uniref:E3 ubiquitin-protein ligase n=1 Tax=Geotrypetes seraphini TaxID=260995 RepID=A0A6P8PR16_GEOSA|nr:probable E3 ubiquitin-protein ligase DTX2 [Geotrypetes seraphini]XP_033777947.1 probable E3 ubiquitin-protein ligase DTX2 [Geotrypetes seraphini]XP_033777948.1 probable E3 ubiquitin-protein ligase DTX2 [Geotrypetes seraphini]XP_033777949.1 probable E3 ubiquitin-protein ligase DTX2 [Geotrypetes seraphini]XP_033777950.1 probable E3 ubiquitin-protein ligase DTX2 [Geotrypetes seraphini]XP_033777951.1 probable E3 ubiquitin-protein ligase DTX2 [Geotrypetes seraphini]XP_033777952.1 probable E3 ub
MAAVPTFGPPGALPLLGPGTAVAVWEWKNEFDCWKPYSGKVSCYIEQCMQAHQNQKGQRAAPGNASSICLGQADPKLTQYIIDIPSMVQFRQDTGTVRDVQKTLYPLKSAPGCGVYWEWMNDEGSWTAYEMAIANFLEKCSAAGQQFIDLGCLGYNYNIDLRSLVQTNKTSGFKRKIQRCVGTPYPVISTSGPIHKGATCSCQQCLVSGGVGPIPSRLRYSMINQQSPFASHSSSHSSATASFVPYPKPSLLGIRSGISTNGPWPLSVPSPTGGTISSNGVSSTSLSIQLERHNKVHQAPADTISEPEQVIKKYLDKMDSPPGEDCIICMEKLSTASGYGDITQSKTIQPEMVGKLKNCGHAFHTLCLLAMYNNGNKDGSLQCPSCKTIYGEKTGTQPNGKMEVYFMPHSLPGHPDCRTIHIMYTILPGIQGPEHPNPGKQYTARGFPRHGFLPDNSKGRKVLDLLHLAWKRRLVFTVGISNTTGEADTVIWNEIHHKTEMGSNTSGHGFPDPNYLDNVLAELAAQGVTEDCLANNSH